MTIAIPEFVPHRWLSNGHAMTIAAAFVPRKFRPCPKRSSGCFASIHFHSCWDCVTGRSWGSQAKCCDAGDCDHFTWAWKAFCNADSNYARGIAEKAYHRGFHVVRMNQRNCGGTEKLTPTLYNSGMSGDYRAVLEELADEGFERVFFAGYSMGGNLVTKMAGEYGEEFPPALRGVCAVCPAIDLSACADALERRDNYLYTRHFVKGLMARYSRKAQMFPGQKGTLTLSDGHLGRCRRFERCGNRV